MLWQKLSWNWHTQIAASNRNNYMNKYDLFTAYQLGYQKYSQWNNAAWLYWRTESSNYCTTFLSTFIDDKNSTLFLSKNILCSERKDISCALHWYCAITRACTSLLKELLLHRTAYTEKRCLLRIAADILFTCTEKRGI